jgi:uncharacterized membrane protein
MRTIKFITIIAAVFVAIFSTVVYFSTLGKKDKPILVCSVDGIIEGSINVTNEELLKYVAASDEQDGDLSSKIKVTRQNRFIGGDSHSIIITFSVCDSDNNVTAIQRLLTFTDYEPPKITLLGDFIFASGYSYTLTDYCTATDLIDGELDDYIKMISPEFTATEGKYPVNIKVTNSLGDTSELNIEAIITTKDYYSTKIRLKEYITYVNAGEKIDYKNFVDGIVYNSSGVRYTLDDIRVDDSQIDLSKAGTYQVFYKIYNANGDMVTMTRLFVVVTEG